MPSTHSRLACSSYSENINISPTTNANIANYSNKSNAHLNQISNNMTLSIQHRPRCQSRPACNANPQHSESVHDTIVHNLAAPILSSRSSNQHQIDDGSDLYDSIDYNYLSAPIIQSRQISNQNHDDRSDLIPNLCNEHLDEIPTDVGHQSCTIVLKRLIIIVSCKTF